METVKNVGDKFTFGEHIGTVKAFFTESGEEFKTAKDAINANPEGIILVQNQEYNGWSNIKDSIAFTDGKI